MVPAWQSAPRHAVCCEGLNLLSQVRSRPDNSALARAYRVVGREIGTLVVGVGSGRDTQHHEHSRVLFLYHIPFGMCRELL